VSLRCTHERGCAIGNTSASREDGPAHARPLKALELLAKHFALLTEVSERVSGLLTVEQVGRMSDEE
jgi:hypothetical protein